MDDALKISKPEPPREAYEAPRLDDLGDVDVLTRLVGSSVTDNTDQ